jgi:hypothetical protein
MVLASIEHSRIVDVSHQHLADCNPALRA